MTKPYAKPKETGREFVDYCSKLCTVTTNRCLLLPKRWETTLLDPIIKTTQRIEELVIAGNAIYVNKEHLTKEEYVNNYKNRLEKFKEAYDLFKVFDIQFDRIMAVIETERSETYRLQQILKNLIEEKNAEDKDLAIKITKNNNSYCYESKSGKEFLRLKLTRNNAEYWLDISKKARDLLGKRISLDRKIVNAF